MLDTLVEQGKTFDLKFTDDMLDKFQKFNDLLISWNEKMNLTGITEPREVAILHFIDSLTVMNYVDLRYEKVIDVGTGAGFPGIPLKIYNPDIKLVLLDSQKKRLNFLDEVIKELELEDVETLHIRSEEAGRSKKYREQFDLCVSRAVAPLPQLVEYMMPLVKVNGLFMAMKGSSVEEEIEESGAGIEILGGEPLNLDFIDMPDMDRTHSIITSRKLRQTPQKYPRDNAQISNKPLE